MKKNNFLRNFREFCLVLLVLLLSMSCKTASITDYDNILIDDFQNNHSISKFYNNKIDDNTYLFATLRNGIDEYHIVYGFYTPKLTSTNYIINEVCILDNAKNEIISFEDFYIDNTSLIKSDEDVFRDNYLYYGFAYIVNIPQNLLIDDIYYFQYKINGKMITETLKRNTRTYAIMR